MQAIRAVNLTKVYRSSLGRSSPSLDGLNLEVAENEVFGFLGRNGAGKTTTIKLFCSLLRPTRGGAFVFEEPVGKRLARRQIGYLPENPYFYEYLTPRETLDFYGRLQGLRRAARQAEWEKLADLLDLRDIAAQRIRTFSKGMRQRLAFAVALVGDPKVLILDEPMSGLDPMGRRAIRELILRMRDEKKTIFFSSHVLSDVEQICDRVGILVKGTLAVQGRIEELLRQQVRHVEVIVSGLDDAGRRELAAGVELERHSEAGDHFRAPTIEAANALVRRAHDRGAAIAEVTPVKQTLEEYFVERQDIAREGAS